MARKGQKFTLTSVLWVPRGAAKSIATRWEPDIEEQFSNTAMKENKKPKKLKKNINEYFLQIKKKFYLFCLSL
jgi:hypothetical protein